MLDLIAAEDYFKKLYLQDIRQLIDCSFFELQKWTHESLTFRTPKDVRHTFICNSVSAIFWDHSPLLLAAENKIIQNVE